MMAHIALTSLCQDRLTATATLPITLLPIRDQENPVWQQRLAAVSNLKGPHFHPGMTSLARYAQYLFNLQHNTARTGMQQRTHLMAYKESATTATGEIERFTITLVTTSMDGTTPVCCSTLPGRRWRPVPTGLSTLSTRWRCRTPRLRRGQRRSPTLSSSYWSFRDRHHLSLSTPRRSMPYRALMRTRSH
jgi:hypothetical protein